MKLEPFGDQSLIKPTAAEEKIGSLFIPGTIEGNVIYGTVIAAGEGLLLDNGQYAPMKQKKGDKVLFDKRASIEIKINGETMYLTRSQSVFGRVVE